MADGPILRRLDAGLGAGERCWVGNGMGKLEVLDLRQQKMMGGLKGFAGSLVALAAHDTQPLLAAVGLDRFLRVYHTGSRQMLAKTFLKQQLTSVAFCPTEFAPLPPAKSSSEAKAQGRKREEPVPKKQRRNWAA